MNYFDQPLSFPNDKDVQNIGKRLGYFDREGEESFIRPNRPKKNPELLYRSPEKEAVSFNWFTVRMLGTGADVQKKLFQSNTLPEEYPQLAALLSSGERAFALACTAVNDGVEFRLGFRNDPTGRYLNSALSSSFGMFDAQPVKNIPTGKGVWLAHCVPVKFDTNSLDAGRRECAPAVWMDAAAAAIISTTCTVVVEFQPVTDKEAIQRELDDLYGAQKELQKFLKRHPQVSMSDGNSRTGNFAAAKLKDVFFKGFKDTISEKWEEFKHSLTQISDGKTRNLSVSYDYIAVDPELESYNAKLQYQIRLLEQTLDAGWLCQMKVWGASEDAADTDTVRSALGAAVQKLGYTCSWSQAENETRAGSLLLPAYMVPELISIPTKPFPGFRLERRSNLNLNPPAARRTDNEGIPIGTILWNHADTNKTLYIPRKELNRHTAVFGMTGGGKTYTVCSILAKLQDLNYLVIEPVKGDYRSIPGIHRYCMAAGDADSLKMNPFWFPEGSSLQYHIDSLKLIISSAFDLYAAMPNILEQCLYRVYVNCGWNLINNQNLYWGKLPEDELYPTFSMLCEEIEQYLDESAFEGETDSNYRGALLSRLQSFTSGIKGVLLNTHQHIPFDRWSKQNVVVELDALADDSDKAIVMGALMVQYFQYIKKCSGNTTNQLKHLFVMEEAHHLFRETQNTNGQNGGASAQLVSMLSDLLAEIRAYGEGFVIIDQSPTSISRSVLKNTAVKIVHRVNYGEDLELLKSAMLMDDDEKITAALEQGEALIRFGSMQLPMHIRIPEMDRQAAYVTTAPAVRYNDTQDRIFRNPTLKDQLCSITTKLMNQLLYTSDRDVIMQAYQWYKDNVSSSIIRYCGADSVTEESLADYCSTVLDACVFICARQAFPDQYCLQKMICMLVSRTWMLLRDSEQGGFSKKAWELLLDYRAAQIYPRISVFMQNETDISTKMLVAILGDIPEAGILKHIVDKLWLIPSSEEERQTEAFYKAVDDLFCVTPAEESLDYFKRMSGHYCRELSEL